MRERPYLSALILVLCLVLADVSGSAALPFGLIKNIPFRFRNLTRIKVLANILRKILNLLRSFVKRLLKVGDTQEDLSDVKEYLDLYGYFNSTSNSNFTDEYTSDLESALQEYQTNFNLNVTGQPDQETLRQMSLPRCGVPDIINGSTTMNSGKQNTTLSFKPWWHTNKTELTYAFYVDENNITDTDNARKAVFRDAFNRWSKYTSLNFTETMSFNDSDILIAFLSIDEQGGTVGGAANNYTTYTGVILLDSGEDWVLPSESMTRESDEVDLETVVMHQIGHLLGLGHSSVETAIMYPSILSSQRRKIVLANDDIERVEKIYGTKSNSNELSPQPPVENTTGDGGRIILGWLRDGWVSTLCIAVAFMVILK